MDADTSKTTARLWILVAGLSGAAAGYPVGATGAVTTTTVTYLGLVAMAVAMAGMYGGRECLPSLR